MKLAKQRSVLLSIVAALILAVSQFGGYAAAVAATTKTPTKPSSSTDTSLNNNANSLRISPLRTDITIAPGKTGTVAVDVKNLTTKSIIISPIENDFVSGDENGTPSVILDQNSYAPTHSLKRFMVPLSNITVPANQQVAVRLTINVPTTAQAGGYFGALRFAPAGTANQPVSLNSSVVSLVLLTVPGPTVQQLNLTNFDIQQNGASASNFRNPNNLSVLVRFENKGNLQEAPFGAITVLKGKKVLYTSQFNQISPKQEILPDSARRWTVALKDLGKFGKYTITGTFGYGNGQTIQVSKTVWIVPSLYIYATIVGVIVLILIIVIIRASLRSYKRKILRGRRYR